MRPTVLALLALAPAFAACVAPQIDPAGLAGGLLGADAPPVLPDMAWFGASYRDGVGFHSLEEIEARIDAVAAARPDLVRVETIGASREERPIRALVLTNLSLGGLKIAPFYDGGHHANELEGIESTLMLADYLLANYDRNATIRSYLDRYEIWIVPVVNPDGYVLQTRGNAMGVNLNRNYDIDWGNPAGGTNRAMGIASGATGMPVRSVGGPVGENPGTEPFSEPEARAIRDALAPLDGRLAFYLSHHTAVPSLLMPWSAVNPPFPVPDEDQAVFDALKAWTHESTIFGAGPPRWGNFESGLWYSASGTSMDWAYAQHRVPGFVLEVAGCRENGVLDPRWGPDNVQCALGMTDRGDLAYWVQASLQINLYLLANAEALHQWQEPSAEPVLPEGVPPEAPYT